jgi:hypothetical protein
MCLPVKFTADLAAARLKKEDALHQPEGAANEACR